MIKNLPHFEGLNCTINTTENCNLRCKYCYETNKTTKSIDLETVKKFIDLILNEVTLEKDIFNLKASNQEWIYGGIILDFIGGDSLIDPELLDRILTYFNYKFSFVSERYPRGWKASLSSNGTLFYREDVRKFCEKWKDQLSLSISIDGCPEIHDMNRVFPDGSGSMKAIMEWWPWYQKTFPIYAQQTKATLSKNSIPYLYDSIKFMYEVLGIRYINANFIMEDTGATKEDYKELDSQFSKIVDYIIEHRNDMYVSLFDRSQFTREGNNQSRQEKDFNTKGRCGSGCMPCLSIDGKIYPCFRWLPASQNGNSDIMCVGSVEKGLTHIENFNKVLNGAIRSNCTKEEKCRTCEYEPGCAYCIAGCYAEYGDFIRTTHICEYTKLQYKWAEEYWRRYDKFTV